MTFVEELQVYCEEKGTATPCAGQGMWEAGAPNRELQETFKKVKLRWHTATIKVMLDPLLGLAQHQQTLLKRLVVRIWPRLVQKQVRQHGVRWPRLSLRLHRHQNVSLGYSADSLCKEHPKWNQVLAERLHHVRNMEGLGAALEAHLKFKGADNSPASELEVGDGDIGGLPIWASSMGKRSHSLPELLVKFLGWKWQDVR